jgi:hypothetical protein
VLLLPLLLLLHELHVGVEEDVVHCCWVPAMRQYAGLELLVRQPCVLLGNQGFGLDFALRMVWRVW